MRPLRIIALLLMAMAAAAMPGYGLIDLISPADGAAINTTAVTFEYYLSMAGTPSCALNLAGTQIPDIDVQNGMDGNGMNNVSVENLISGAYAWNVSCTNGTAEHSTTRTMTIDNRPPTLAIISPLNGSTVKMISLDFVPYEENGTLSCTIRWNGTAIETVSVAANAHYLKNYSLYPGTAALGVTCVDAAGNIAAASRTVNLEPDLMLKLQLDKQQYGIGEAPKLTITSLAGANVTVDICPDQSGFVQCTSALIDTNSFPQTVTLPVMNRTGGYIVDGIASYGNQSRVNRTTYNVTNTMLVDISREGQLRLNRSFNLSASVTGGVAPYRFAWQMSNGTAINGVSSVSVIHLTPGNYTQRVTAYDQANNSRSQNLTYTIDPAYNMIFQVSDSQTGEAVLDAEIDLTFERTDEEQSVRTIQGGIAYATLDEGTHRVFISAPNYEYYLAEHHVNASKTISIKLTKAAASIPQVSITSPGDDTTVRSPVTIGYSAISNSSLTCTLLFGDQNNWFRPNGSMRELRGDFVRDLSPGQYAVRVECADTKSRTGSSATTRFTVTAEQQQTAQTAVALAEEQRLQDAIEGIDVLIESLGGYDRKERDAAEALGYDRQLRNAKRALQQAVRDINDLQHRNDLDDAGRLAERKRILEGAEGIITDTPLQLRVTDSKSYVKYLKEEDMPAVAASLAGLGGITASERTIAKRLWPDQQKFTVSTRIMEVEQVYGDDRVKTVTIVTRAFTYAPGLTPDYQVYEIIPKEVATSAKELQLITKAEILKDDPVLRFGTMQNITYIIPKRADHTRIEQIKTVIARPYAEESMITGFAILGGIGLDGQLWPVIALVALITIVYLVYYFDLIKQVKYLLYSMGKKEKLHYIRVNIDEAIGQLEANDYGRAEMIYKEVRLSYDMLPLPAKNELYEDIMDLVHRMDAYYFNMVMIELDEHMKAGDMENAIACYEKLNRIYEHLDAQRQEQLVQTVMAMGKRLGVAA